MGREMWWGDGVSYRMECINKKCGRIVLAEGDYSELKKSTFIFCIDCKGFMKRLEVMV